MIVCAICDDTHRMALRDRDVPCTHCPSPCQVCRSGGVGAYCERPACRCSCHAGDARIGAALLALESVSESPASIPAPADIEGRGFAALLKTPEFQQLVSDEIRAQLERKPHPLALSQLLKGLPRRCADCDPTFGCFADGHGCRKRSPMGDALDAALNSLDLHLARGEMCLPLEGEDRETALQALAARVTELTR